MTTTEFSTMSKKTNYIVGKNGKVYTEATVAELIDTNPQFMERALIKIYDRQTEDEKVAKITHYHNHVGFSAAHASKMCYYAKWVLSGRKLSGPHLEKCKAILKKYRKQILHEIAAANPSNN